MFEYVLITFYNRCDIKNPCWDVYGHIKTYNNDLLMSFSTRSQAIEYAHTFGLPVLEGTNKNDIVERLCNETK